MSNQFIPLEPNKIYGIPLHNGYLRIDVSCDPNYPGLDIEYIDNQESNGEQIPATRPRVLIEAPVDESTGKSNNVRALIWGDIKNEDYSDAIEFDDYTKVKS